MTSVRSVFYMPVFLVLKCVGFIDILEMFVILLLAVNPTVSGNDKSSEPYCEWELLKR